MAARTPTRGRGGSNFRGNSRDRTTQPVRNQPDFDAYFGSHHGIRLNPVQGTHYDQQSFRTMLPRQVAEDIVKKTVVFFRDPFDACVHPGGLGDVVLAFADQDKVNRVYVSEPDPAVAKFLLNNISAYKYQQKVEIVPSALEVPASILFVDTIRSAKINIGSILQRKLFPLYAFRVPAQDRSRIQETPFPGYETGLEQLPDSTLLLLCQPIVDEEPEFDPDFVSFIDATLTPIVDDRQEYLTPEHLAIWQQAFTDVTVDAEYNYEVLEMLGDRMMKASFADYNIRRIPGITERELTELQNHYLVREAQSDLATKMGLIKWIRIAGEMHEKVPEDVLEAFFGALFRVSEEVSGNGYTNVFNMILFLYGKEPLEEVLLRVRAGRDKTVFIQTFPGLHLNTPDVQFTYGDVLTKATIRLDQNSREAFKKFGFSLPQILASVEAKSKKQAETAAYSQALETLRKEGITAEWVDARKAEVALERPELLPYLGAAKARLEKEGYVKMEIVSPESTTTQKGCVVQLIGFDPKGRRHILASASNCGLKAGRIEVVKSYAEGN